MKKIIKYLFVVILSGLQFCFFCQTTCNVNGNLMLYTNYDGGTLTINVDQNIPNLKIGICSYEACYINFTGAFVNNVTAVRYAGYNGNNSNCGVIIPTTTIVSAPVGAITSTVYMPAVNLINANGYNFIICGYSCSNNTNQGGCNTVDQIEAYFLNYFNGSSLYAHKVQYGCWTATQSLSIGGNCCPANPVLPGVIASNQNICLNSTPLALTSLSIASGGTGPITYTWQSSTTSTNTGFVNIPGANNITYSPLNLLTTTYYRRSASTNLTNTMYSNAITVSVIPLPNISITGNFPICFGNSSSLTASGANTYTWSTGSNLSSVIITPTISTTYSIICTSSLGCNNLSIVNVTVNALPSITISGNNPICLGGSLSLKADGANTYTWSTGANSSSLNITPTISGTYSVIGTSSLGCNNISMVNVTVNALPSITILGNSPICFGSSSSLTASGANTYTWSIGINSNSIIVSPTITTTYSLIGVNQEGCRGDASITITVSPLPILSITGNTKICTGEISMVTINGLNTCTWNPGSITGNPASLSPSSTVIYSVSGTSSLNCLVTRTLQIIVIPCTSFKNQEGGSLSINIYPNPFNEEINIVVASKLKGEIITISNVLGQVLYSAKLESEITKLNMNNFSKGTYFIRIDNNNGLFKIIKF